MGTNNSILYEDLSYEIMRAVYEVHSALVSGFFEKVYERALLEGLNIRRIKAVAQKNISVLRLKKSDT